MAISGFIISIDTKVYPREAPFLDEGADSVYMEMIPLPTGYIIIRLLS